MGIRFLIGIALSAAFLSAALASPVPSSSPTPTPAPSPTRTLAPIVTGGAPAPNVSPSPGQPKLIGHIYTSAYCSSFVEHFNGASQVVIVNDQHLDAVDTDLHAIENDWNRRDGTARVYDDRVKLIGEVTKMLKSIPASQAEVNALLAQAKTTTDPERKAALQEAASQLQRTVDRQRAMAYDLTNVIHVLLDKHTAEDTAETNINYLLPAGVGHESVSLLDDPVPEAGQDTMMDHGPTPTPSPGTSPTPKPGSIEDILQWTRERSIIGEAESRAAVAADRVVRTCDAEVSHSPPPSPKP